MHARTHAYTRTHARTHARTHTHTHNPNNYRNEVGGGGGSETRITISTTQTIEYVFSPSDFCWKWKSQKQGNYPNIARRDVNNFHIFPQHTKECCADLTLHSLSLVVLSRMNKLASLLVSLVISSFMSMTHQVSRQHLVFRLNWRICSFWGGIDGI